MLWVILLLTVLFIISSRIAKLYSFLNRIDTTLSKYFVVPEQPFIGSYFKFNAQEKLLKSALELTKKYGNAIKINMFMCISGLIISDVKILEYILGTTSIMHKGHGYSLLRKWLGEGLLVSKGEKWKLHRKMLSPAFHFNALEKFVKTFQSPGEILIQKLYTEINCNYFDIHFYIVLCIQDILGEAIMGTKLHAQKNSTSEYVLAAKQENELACNRVFSIWKIFNLPYRFSSDYRREKRLLEVLHGYTQFVIEKRKEELSENKDSCTETSKKGMTLLDLLLTSSINGQPLTDREIQEQVDTFMFAGLDTTSTAISFTLYSLSKEKAIQERVVEELKEILQDDKDKLPTLADLHKMKYLEMVIKETLRLYPPVPFYFRETNRDTPYKDGILPTKTQIGIFAYGVHRDPENFSDPEKFDPDRFLPENQAKRNPYSYIPFSAGPRNCIGQKFAMLQMKYIVSEVVKHFEIHPAVPECVPELIPVPVLRAKDGLFIKVRKRKQF